METRLHPPRTGMEVYKLLPEGTLCQLINNKIVISPSPKWKHQDIIQIIMVAIGNYLKKNRAGKVLSDVDVYLDEENVYRPDIMLITNEQSHILSDDGYMHGSPALIIEVLSEGTQKYDRTEKKDIYEKYGVKEYWLIDPATLKCEGFINENNNFKQIAKTNKNFTIRLLDLTIKLD
jgi:Uma2 family endonuclease